MLRNGVKYERDISRIGLKRMTEAYHPLVATLRRLFSRLWAWLDAPSTKKKDTYRVGDEEPVTPWRPDDLGPLL